MSPARPCSTAVGLRFVFSPAPVLDAISVRKKKEERRKEKKGRKEGGKQKVRDFIFGVLVVNRLPWRSGRERGR